MILQVQEATSQSGSGDPVLDALEASQIPPTIDSYLRLAYPDRKLPELKADAEVMSMIPPSLAEQ